MGSVKKALKPITRVVDDIIPNEIKPALPYIAATFGAPYLAGSGFLGGITNAALRKGVAGALANVGTQVALGKNVNPVSAGISGLLAGGGAALSKMDAPFAKTLGEFVSPDKIGGMTLGQVSAAATTPVTAGTIEAVADSAREAEEAYEQYLAEQEAAGNEDFQTRKEFISLYLANAGFDQETINKRLNQLGYAANGGLMGTRIGFKNGGDVGTLGDSMQKIRILLMKNEIMNAGGGGFGGKDLDDKTDDEIIEIHEDLFGQDKANGGIMATRVGFKEGSFVFDPRPGYGDRGRVLTVKDVVNPNDRFLKFLFPTEDFPKSKRQISEELEKVMKDSDKKDDGMMARDDRIGTLFNLLEAERMAGDDADLDLIKEYEAELSELLSPRKTAAEGGIMNLKVGGKPAEMDLRKGGFVPIGAKEKADDVPARLSKNEFVMTADAVRAAGGGSVNKGAKRMYDLMNKLEAKV